MSRKITVIEENKSVRTYGLSIATIKVDTNDKIVDVEIQPFIKEIAGVTYYDTPITIRIGDERILPQ